MRATSRRTTTDKAKKSDEAEKAERESESREAYDAAVRAYLYAKREQFSDQREELREQLRERREELHEQFREELRTQHEVQRVLQRDLIDVGVAPYIVPTLSPGLIGEINGGGVEIRLTSMSGSIYVRRGK